MSAHPRSRILINIYFVLIALEAIWVLVWLSLTPTDPKNAWLLGYSLHRVIMLGGDIVLLISSLFLFFRTRLPKSRFSDWIIQKSSNPEFFLVSFFIALFLVVVCLLVFFYPLSVSPEYLARLAPLSILAGAVGIQTLVLLIFLNHQLLYSYLQRAIFPVALVIVILVALFQIFDLLPEYASAELDPDVIGYRLIAKNMSHPYDTDIREPVWIWFIKAVTFLGGEDDIVLRVFGLGLFGMTGYMLYRLVEDVFSDRFLVVVVLAIYSWNTFLIRTALRCVRDNMLMLAVVGVVYFTFSNRKHLFETSRLLGLSIFYFLAGGTQISSLAPLGLIILYAFARNRIRYSLLVPLFFCVLFILGPHFIHNYMKYDDPLYSANIHAVWWRNLEFVAIDGTGCTGCPSSSEYQANSYSGEWITTVEYIIGMHSPTEILTRSIEGFRVLFLSPSQLFNNLLGVDELGLVFFFFYATGIIILIFVYDRNRILILIPPLVINILLFLIPYAPDRFFITVAPFFAVFAAIGFVSVIRWIMRFVLTKITGNVDPHQQLLVM